MAHIHSLILFLKSAADEIEVVTNVLRANSQTIISRSLPMVIDTAWSLAIGKISYWLLLLHVKSKFPNTSKTCHAKTRICLVLVFVSGNLFDNFSSNSHEDKLNTSHNLGNLFCCFCFFLISSSFY